MRRPVPIADPGKHSEAQLSLSSSRLFLISECESKNRLGYNNGIFGPTGASKQIKGPERLTWLTWKAQQDWQPEQLTVRQTFRSHS